MDQTPYRRVSNGPELEGTMFRFVDLFSGLGGFHIAAEALGGDCVFACELCPKLRQIYQGNFEIECAGDINNVRVADVPHHDLLCAGFPCQPFSKAGDQRGFSDPVRGKLFYKILDILDSRKPRFFVLENVAHFFRHDLGKTYAKLKKSLEKPGYSVAGACLSPHHFGIPQIRERMYVVGARSGLTNFRWPEPTSSSETLNLREFLDINPPNATRPSDQVIACIEVWQNFLDRMPVEEQINGFPIWAMEFRATYPFNDGSLHSIRLPLLRRTRGNFGAKLQHERRREIFENLPSHAKRDSFPRWKQSFIRKNRDLYRRNEDALRPWLHQIMPFPPSLQKFEWHGDGKNIWDHIIQFRASGVRVKRPTTAPSLVAMTTSQVPIVGWERRYMTMRECSRLQSLDKLKSLPTGRAAVTALGNAVNASVARLVISSLLGLSSSNPTSNTESKVMTGHQQ
jgi:DNA (cytosine-5)-methyltransferase 1